MKTHLCFVAFLLCAWPYSNCLKCLNLYNYHIVPDEIVIINIFAGEKLRAGRLAYKGLAVLGSMPR